VSHSPSIIATLLVQFQRAISLYFFILHGIVGLTALELGSANPDFTVALHTFGMPRTGDKDFVQLLLKHVKLITRMTHQHDMIPHLPPKELDYHHVPTEVRRLPYVIGYFFGHSRPRFGT
jgi:predicted lipase